MNPRNRSPLRTSSWWQLRPSRPAVPPAGSLACSLAALLALASCDEQGPSADNDPQLFTVEQRLLPITIKEVAELQALRETVVRSDVEGSSTIIYMIPEGSVVAKGELLVKLDASSLEDKLANQRISVAKAEAARDQAEKSLEILEKELIAKRNTAMSNLRIAQMDLDKFLGTTPQQQGPDSQGKNADMARKLRELVEAPLATTAGKPRDPEAVGAAADATDAAAPTPAPILVANIDPRRYASLVDKAIALLDDGGGVESGRDPLQRDMGDMANRILQQVDRIRLAMADLKYQEAYYGHSTRLAALNFLTPNELEKDRIEFERRLSQVGLAWNDLDLLISYELFKDRIRLLQDVANAELELERVEATNDAERVRSRTDLDSKKAEYDLAKERLDNLERQIKNAEIFAPTPGLVIYAREERGRRNSDSVREGISVRERQELIVLPDTTKMQAIVKIQEAVISQVAEGQRAHIKVEAYPDRTFTGVVTNVAQQADSNSGWMSSDRKVYSTTIVIDGDNTDSQLRSRMAAEVTVLVDELHDVTAVPLQAVRRDRSVNYVWRHTAQGPVATPVEVGRRNAEHVVILQGVAVGDRVYLAQPRGLQPPSLPQPAVAMPDLTTGLPESRPAADPETGGAPERGGSGNGGGDGRRPGTQGGTGGPGGPGGGPGNMTEEQQAQMAQMRQLGEQVKQFLLTKYPERQEEIEDRRQIRQLYEDPAIKAALESELGAPWQQYSKMLEEMRSRFGSRGRGGNPGGGTEGGGRRPRDDR